MPFCSSDGAWPCCCPCAPWPLAGGCCAWPGGGGVWVVEGCAAGAFEGGGGGGASPGGAARGGSAGAWEPMPTDGGALWPEACALNCAAVKQIRAKRRKPKRPLLRRRIVAGFGINMERRQSFRRNELDLNFMPFAIVHWFGWTVAEHILVAQLYSDLCGHVGQLVGVIHRKGASASDFGDFRQQGGAGLLF